MSQTILEATVTQALPNTMFRVKVADGHEVLVTIKGSMRKGFTRIFPGDKVRVELSEYEDDRGRIVYKY